MLNALRSVSKDVIRNGGKIAVRYTGDGEQKMKGFNAPKLYRVWYEAPAQELPDDAPFGYDDPDELPF